MGLNRPAAGWLSQCERVLVEVTRAVGAHAIAGGVAPALTPVTRLEPYLDLLLKWNAQLDLTAARHADELVDLFLADAALLALVAPTGEPWLDVGSGAGAPGLVLKLLRPDLPMRLVEPKSKRVTFMRTALATLGVSGVEVTRDLSSALPAACSMWAVSRATLAPSLWLSEGARLATRGVWVLLAQGDVPTLPGWRADKCIAYHWPLTGVERRAVLFMPEPAVDGPTPESKPEQ